MRNFDVFAPILLVFFNRPEHTEGVLNALKKNLLASKSDLIVVSDAPRNASDEPLVHRVREICKYQDGFNSIKLIERAQNYGLTRNIIEGVSQVVGEFGRVIVLEDDIVTSEYFLQFMNEALELYKNDAKVASIGAFVPSVSKELPETYFLKGSDCWGWATWDRAWGKFESSAEKLMKDLKERRLLKEFDWEGRTPNSRIYKDISLGRINLGGSDGTRRFF